MKFDDCTHINQLTEGVERQTAGCAECLKDGVTKWIAIRECLTCGHVGCCDSSIGRHARKHFEETGHPIISSKGDPADPKPEWRWCYVDDDYIEA